MTVRRPVRLLALVLAAWPAAALAQRAATNPNVSALEKRILREQEQALRQQQQSLQRQQREMQKLYQQQQRLQQQHLKAQQDQLKAHQRLLEQQTRLMHAQSKSKSPSQPGASGSTASAGAPAAAASKPAQTPHPGTHASAAHHAGGAVVHVARHGHGHGHGLYHWPTTANNAAARNLYHLKRTLDGIKISTRPAASHRQALQNALMRVTQQPVLTNVSHVQVLSGHLVDGLSRRGLATVNTQQLALHLRAVMNSPLLSPPELEQTLVESRVLLSQASVPEAQLKTITGDLQYLAINR